MDPVVNVSESGIPPFSPTVDSVKGGETSLESILPLLKLLPALILEQSTYHLRGAISKSDLQEFSDHARLVGEFSLTSNRDSSSDGFTFAPGTFVRLGQLQNRDSRGPLFPSLKRLRLINPDEWSMSQLPLFFTPSLQSLEVMNTPENQQSVLLSFLITLVDEAPRVTSITLGPGILTIACLEACLNFQVLRHLVSKEVNFSMNLNHVTAIAKLPLETLVLDDRIGYYRGYYRQDEKPLVVGFMCLQKLHITGELGLIRLFYKSVGSVVLEDLGLTLVRYEPPTWKGLSSGKRKKSKGTSSHRVSTSSTDETEVDPVTRHFCNLLQEGSWRQTLKSVRLNHIEDYHDSDSQKPVDLPVAILNILMEYPNLEYLEITGWTPSGQALFNDTSKNFPNLKTICFPVGSETSGSTIRLTELPFIAESHPNLVFLQFGIESLSNFTVPRLSIETPSHGLKILSVGNSPEAADTIDWKQKINIAAFLDTLFPNLERIETQAGPNSEAWECIYDLVKMCQTSRLIHAKRHSASSQAGDGK